MSAKLPTMFCRRRMLLPLLATVLLAVTPSCKSGPEPINPFDSFDDSLDDNVNWSLLDDVDSTNGSSNSSSSPPSSNATGHSSHTQYAGWPLLDDVKLTKDPRALTYELTRNIDGQGDDWDLSKARLFSDSQFVEVGRESWSGASDLSFRVEVNHDDGHIYFWIDVSDDNVLMPDPQTQIMSDAIIIWLQDPTLQTFLDVLPDTIAHKANIQTQTAIMIGADGTVSRYRGDGLPVDASVTAATVVHDKGYHVEVAIALEALHHVSSIPLQEIAFRVEATDGDSVDSPGVETVMNMIPPGNADDPNFAVRQLGSGVNSQRNHATATPRRQAIGVWEYRTSGWSFRSFESFPIAAWFPLSDVSELESRKANIQGLSRVCDPARNDGYFVEAYQSRNSQHLVGLYICGNRAINNQCPANATSKLYWMHLRANGPQWHIESTHDVFQADLPQCPSKPSGHDPFYDHFSLSPMPVSGTSLWAVGWRETEKSNVHQSAHHGVHFFSVKENRQKAAGDIRTRRVEATRRKRLNARSQIYFVQIDDEPGFDICEIESTERQTCSGVHKNCRTPQRGTERQTHIKVWDEKQERFQSYLLNRHAKCTSSFVFEKSDTYLLIHLGERLGLIASPSLSSPLQ